MDGLKTLGEMIIPTLPTYLILQFLHSIPNGPTIVEALEELANREFSRVFAYLLTLPFSHSHRDVFKSSLETRLRNMPVDDLKQLSGLLPKLSALTYSQGEWIPVMEPLSDYETGLWDTNDWFFQLLHARQMEGQLFSLSARFYRSVSILTFIHLQLSFS